jgi:hypothetical protein
MLAPGMLLATPVEGRIIATLWPYGSRDKYEYSASDQSKLHLEANQLLIWEVIKLACNWGARFLDFARSNRSLMSFIEFRSRGGAPSKEFFFSTQKRELGYPKTFK